MVVEGAPEWDIFGSKFACQEKIGWMEEWKFSCIKVYCDV